MTIIPKSRIIPVNSTSYIDMLGVLAGLARLPGETSDRFAERIDLSVSADRGSEYVGLMNSLSIELGLDMAPAATISSALDFTIQTEFGTLNVSVNGNSLHIPLMTLSSDNFWEWKKLSAVLVEMSVLTDLVIITAGPDVLAHQVARQSNVIQVIAESLIGSRTVRLQQGRLVDGSLQFSGAVPLYVVAADRQTLHFNTPCPEGITASYRYRTSPYSLVVSPVSVFSLTDPLVRWSALGHNGQIVYQVREYVQEILHRDASYWGR